MIDEILLALEQADENEKQAVSRAKKASKQKKPPETIEEAFKRILGMKLKEDERAIVFEVERLLRTGEEERLGDKKLSKKEVFEIWKIHELKLREQKKQYIIETKPDNFWIVTERKQLLDIHDMLKEESLTAWDTETEGLDIFGHRIVGYSAYLPKNDIAFYLPFAHTTGQAQLPKDAALALAKEYLENPNNATEWHHFKYDGHMFANHGITIANAYWDTQVVAKILNEHESHRLKELYAKYILKAPDDAIMFEDLFDDMRIVDKDIVLSGIYAAGDAHKTHKLAEFQKPFIESRDNLKTVWYEIEHPLLQVDLAMEREGFRIDLDRLKELQVEFAPTIEKARQDIIDAFCICDEFLEDMSKVMGREIDEFNIDSPQHLAYLIYDYIGINENFGQKFGKAARTTASDVVDALCERHEELKPILEYRKLFKLNNTYVEKIPQAIEPSTGKLHSRFNNLAGDDGRSGTATGRYSSSEYVSAKHSVTGHARGTNLQNIPSKGKGVEIRRCFIPEDDWIFVGSDLSQIEPRIIATLLADRYNDTAMQELYKRGVDLYTTMAMKTFGFAEEYCVDKAYDPTHTYQPRKLMKTGVLAFLYGQSPKSFARKMNVTDEVAEQFFDGMTSAFVGLEAFRDDVLRTLLHKGYVETLWGRKRRFPEYRKDRAELERLSKLPRMKATAEDRSNRSKLWAKCAKAERQAINAVVQGSAADVLKQNMVQLYKWTKEHGYKFHASIHDEVLLSVPKKDLTPELVQAVSNMMTQTVKLSTPLKSDTVIMQKWMDEISPSDWDFENCCPKEAS